jgi:transposase InsO family protein
MEKQREEFVNEVQAGELTKSKLCAKYGISRVTGDKWLKRFAEGESMSNQSRAPFHTPCKTNPEVEATIIQVRLEHPAWGPRKIVRFLENAGVSGLPSPSTVCAILKRNGHVTAAASKASTPYKRFEREQPNELWQADFKGHFQMLNGLRCHPLTVIDDCSRFALCVDAKDNERYEGVVESFNRMFAQYGLPSALLCDNGNPWGTSQTTGYTRFEVWLMKHGILPIHGRPLHPQTQGKEERFNRTLKDEVLKQTSLSSLTHAQEAFDRFRECYNRLRPHAALALDTPGSRYTSSERHLQDISQDWACPQGYQRRIIKHSGFLTFGGQGYFLSEAFGGETVAVRESSIKYCINVYFHNFRVARINVDERVFVSRKIYRVDDIGVSI